MSAQPPFLRADDIHARIGSAWPAVLAQLGIADEFLRPRKAGPCPACGGRDRYVFDNKLGRGDFFCRNPGCGPGSGFDLLMRVYDWSFAEARRHVLQAAGLCSELPRAPLLPPTTAPAPSVAEPTGKVRAVTRSACSVADCSEAVAYLESRALWPLPAGCTLRAHPSLEYWRDGERARYAGLVAEVRDVAGELVTAHVTYLRGGRKLDAPDCRKLLSPMTGRSGCAVRLMPVTGDTMGIAEGIETALSAAVIGGVPTWAALNAGLLAKFEPPESVQRLLTVFADRDMAGLEAAAHLLERLQGRIRFELRLPPAPHKDWNDVLTSRGRP